MQKEFKINNKFEIYPNYNHEGDWDAQNTKEDFIIIDENNGQDCISFNLEEAKEIANTLQTIVDYYKDKEIQSKINNINQTTTYNGGAIVIIHKNNSIINEKEENLNMHDSKPFLLANEITKEMKSLVEVCKLGEINHLHAKVCISNTQSTLETISKIWGINLEYFEDILDELVKELDDCESNKQLNK